MVRVKPELVGLPEKALTHDAARNLQFNVHAARWVNSMTLHRCTVVVVEKARGGFGVKETGTEGRTVRHCEILEGISERVGRG